MKEKVGFKKYTESSNLKYIIIQDRRNKYSNVYVYMCVRMLLFMCVCIYIHTYIYVCIYICAYILLYTYTITLSIQIYQQVFIYNEEAQCSSHTSCTQVRELTKALALITGGTHCFHDYISVISILFLWDLSSVSWITYDHLWLHMVLHILSIT